MNSSPGSGIEPIWSVPGSAADHLYRAASAKASFWETIIGSSLRAKRRARISALPDGTHCFDVPLFDVEPEILGRALAFMNSNRRAAGYLEAAALLGGRSLRLKLIGLQPRGQSRATFSLRIEPEDPDLSIDPAVGEAFRSWFEAEGSRVTRETLIPFGFTPDSGEPAFRSFHDR